jgi:predicted nucleic acid-binding protein
MEKWQLTDELLEFSRHHQLLIPERVRQEFVTGDIRELDRIGLAQLFLPVPVELEESLVPYFNFDSTDGAIWVVSHGMHTVNSCCVIDEEFARNICKFLGVHYTGSIGIVRQLIESGILSKADVPKLKAKVRLSSFFHDRTLLDGLDK